MVKNFQKLRTMQILNRTKLSFYINISIFLVLSILVYVLKKYVHVPDFIDKTSFLISLAPIIFIAAILVAYAIYDRLAKKAKDLTDSQEQWRFFNKAHNIKFILITIGSLAITAVLLLYWKEDYLYLLGISLVIYLLSYPTQLKFDQQFSHNLEQRYSQKQNENS